MGLVSSRRKEFGGLKVVLSLVAVSVMSALPRTSLAQVSGSLDRFDASQTPDDDFHLSRPGTPGHLRFAAQAHFDYGYNPLVYERSLGDSGSEAFSVVKHHLTANIGLSLGLGSRFLVFAGLPITLWMDGEQGQLRGGAASPAADGTGLGDLYLGGRFHLLSALDGFLALALQGTVSVPTAGDQRFRGEDSLTFHPELLVESAWAGGLRVAANLGARVRQNTAEGASNLAFNDELTWSLGGALPVWESKSASHHLDAYAQIYGASSFSQFFDREQTPLEAIVGCKFFHQTGWVFGAALGPGLTRGIGSPDLRVVGMVGFALPEEEPSDDGPRDRDQDGIVDDKDRCPEQPEDLDGFEDQDGCPDVDNDKDQILDTDDSCPMKAEDHDGYEDEDGCPDPDNDGDSVLDVEDNCPNKAGIPENHGCTATQHVRIQRDQIELLDKVYFDTNKATIMPQSFPLLDNVAAVLKAHPEIRRVRVEGHTDSRGSEAYNKNLSMRRAQSVVRFLVDQGQVSPDILEAVGYGEEQPLVPGARTSREHARNRRVEFHIVKDHAIESQGRVVPRELMDGSEKDDGKQ